MKYTISEILKGSEYALTIFREKEVKAVEIFDKGGKPYLTCAVSDKARPAKPEEIVRQLYLRKLMTHYGYVRAILRFSTGCRTDSFLACKRAMASFSSLVRRLVCFRVVVSSQ
jgi:type I restriction enzyme M protein